MGSHIKWKENIFSWMKEIAIENYFPKKIINQKVANGWKIADFPFSSFDLQ